MSGFNSFVSANVPAFAGGQGFNWPKFIQSQGRMLPPANVVPSGSGANRTVVVTHPVNDRYALPTDRIAITIIDSEGAKVRYAQVTASTRGSSTTTSCSCALDSAANFGGDSVFTASYVRADGSEVSNSRTVA